MAYYSYFHSDGSYGSGSPVVVDTDNWTPEMWEAIDDIGDMSRKELAIHFKKGLHYFGDSETARLNPIREYFNGERICQTCGLSNSELHRE